MDQEIDLRPYAFAILRHWRLLIICTLGLTVIGGGFTVLTVRSRSANADVLIVPVTSQVTLDSRFQTTNGNQATTPAAQRQALINLANSPALAETVFQKLGPSSANTSSESALSLLDKVSVSSSSDLLQITVSDSDENRALKIAETWGKTYESLVANVYSRSQSRTELLTLEIDASRQRYSDAQTALETFLTNSQLIQMRNQMASLNDLLRESRQSQVLLYTDYLSRTREIDLILQDAQTMREQASSQATSSFADRFTDLLLRARVVDNTAPVFQLNMGDLTSGETAISNLVASLDQLIAVLSSRRDQLLAQSNTLADEIASSKVVSAGFDTPTRQRYIDQLSKLNSTYEQLQAKQTILTQQRDLARDTLMLLQRKRDEQDVARSSPQVEVRFISANIRPASSPIGRLMLNAIVAGVAGLALGIMLALIIDILIPALRQISLPKPAQPVARSDAPTDRPIPGD